ncbi:hypothetical protein B296_00014327 [Ensete ventricosum]|uniref:Uncharacterized protein n=1 Tax=Ensete ventricosum TaxID=4639 RepID=A0A427B603_ENSVE|nr:hypothetical protein B296_00014327 [Ensete ventricosum]
MYISRCFCSDVRLKMLLFGGSCGVMHESLVEVGVPDMAPQTIKSMPQLKWSKMTQALFGRGAGLGHYLAEVQDSGYVWPRCITQALFGCGAQLGHCLTKDSGTILPRCTTPASWSRCTTRTLFDRGAGLEQCLVEVHDSGLGQCLARVHNSGTFGRDTGLRHYLAEVHMAQRFAGSQMCISECFCSDVRLEMLLFYGSRGVLHEGLDGVGAPDVAPPTIKSMPRLRWSEM